MHADPLRPLLALALLLGLVSSCAAPQRASSWMDHMEAWFNQGSLDGAELPRGHWSREEEELLQRRMGFAEVVAVGTLRRVTQVARSESPRELALVFRPSEVIFGSLEGQLDEEGAMPLRLDPSSAAFHAALSVESRLAGSRHLLFLRRGPGGVFHWACYRPTPSLVAEVRARYRWLAARSRGA